MPTIAGCDDPILTESLLRYRMPAFAGMTDAALRAHNTTTGVPLVTRP